ncbi:AEC family transporter [bacterium]|nr:AEC family transporter [bacterium]MBU1993988.1 AEC family transporter [bacterium]
MENFALIFVAIFVGYIVNQLQLLPKDAPNILNQFVIYISLPAMVLLQIPKLSFSSEVFIPIVLAWIVMSISALLIFFISKKLEFSREVTGALMLVGVLGNTSFLGIPIVHAYFGETAIPHVLMYDQLGAFIALATYGTFIASYYSNTSEINIKIITFKILTFPPMIALAVALMLMGTTFHPAVISVLSSFADTIVPIALVAVGLQLQFKLPNQYVKPFSISLFVKLVLAPLVAYGVCFVFSWDNQASLVSIMESGMGPMITAGVVASMAGLAPRLSSAIVGYGTLLSFLTTAVLFKLIV